MTLAVDKWIGVALVAQYVADACQENYGNGLLATQRTPNSSNKTK